jgi:hypothetical protein
LDSTDVIFRRYDVLRIKGEALEVGGDLAEARASLERAIANAFDAGSRRGQWQALAALSGFLARNSESGAEQSSQAQKIIDAVAEEIGDEKLRKKFELHAGKLLVALE